MCRSGPLPWVSSASRPAGSHSAACTIAAGFDFDRLTGACVAPVGACPWPGPWAGVSRAVAAVTGTETLPGGEAPVALA